MNNPVLMQNVQSVADAKHDRQDCMKR
jgi:hypothetical protein